MMSNDTEYGIGIALDCAQQEAFQLLDRVGELEEEVERLREDYRTLTLSFADVKAAELKEKIENKRLRHEVKEAYFEAWYDADPNSRTNDSELRACWEVSEAKEATII